MLDKNKIVSIFIHKKATDLYNPFTFVTIITSSCIASVLKYFYFLNDPTFFLYETSITLQKLDTRASHARVVKKSQVPKNRIVPVEINKSLEGHISAADLAGSGLWGRTRYCKPIQMPDRGQTDPLL